MKKTCTIIYDGKKREGYNLESEYVSNVRIVYSLNFTADYMIMQSIKHDKEPKMTTVVTSDKAIVGYLKKFGTPVISSDTFCEILKTSLLPEIEEEDEKESDVSLSESEVDFWADFFKTRKMPAKKKR